MGMTAERFRSEAADLEKAAQALLQSASSTSSIRDKLLALFAITEIEALKDSLSIIINELPSSGEESRKTSILVGFIAAHVKTTMADALDALSVGSFTTNDQFVARRTQMERNAAMNRAASRGDWNEFDRLNQEYTAEIMERGTATGSRDQSTGPLEGEAVNPT